MAVTEGFAEAVTVITGGASGIGRALASELARRGALVVLADVDGDAAVRVAASIATAVGRPGAAVGRALDVRDADAFVALVDDVAARMGTIDLLFNNAGISIGGPTHELAGAHWDRIIDVNIRGVVNGMLAAYPRMIEQGHGHIVNTASAAGLVATPMAVPYAMTKHAVVGLSTGVRPEAARLGVRVSVLCPGAVDTAILDRPPDDDLPATASAPVTARQFLEVLRQEPMDADLFARQALRGVARNRGIIIVPREAAALWYLFRLSPRVMESIERRVVAAATDRLVRPATQETAADRGS